MQTTMVLVPRMFYTPEEGTNAIAHLSVGEIAVIRSEDFGAKPLLLDHLEAGIGLNLGVQHDPRASDDEYVPYAASPTFTHDRVQLEYDKRCSTPAGIAVCSFLRTESKIDATYVVPLQRNTAKREALQTRYRYDLRIARPKSGDVFRKLGRELVGKIRLIEDPFFFPAQIDPADVTHVRRPSAVVLAVRDISRWSR